MMKIAFKYYFLIIIAVVVASCKSDISEIKQTAAFYEPAKETGHDIEMLYTDWGQLKIKLIAPRVVRHRTQNPYLEFPDGLNLYFYNDSLSVISELRANYAIRYENVEQTIFRDSVYVVNENQEELFTDELVWDERKEKIHSDKFVKVVTPDERILGTGFEANQDLTNYKVRNITGIINVETEQDNEDI